MYIFCSADRTKPGAISLLTSAWKRLLIILSLKVGKIGQSIIDTHKKIESATVGTYKSVENYVVDATRPSRRLLWTGSSKKSRMKTTNNNRI